LGKLSLLKFSKEINKNKLKGDKMKKLSIWALAIVLAFLMVINFSLASCKEQSVGEAAEGVEETAEKAVLTFWTLQQSAKEIESAQEEAVKDFEDKYNCDVQVTSFPYVELSDKLLAATASGQGPDLVLLDQIWVAQYAAAGFVIPIDDRMSGSPIKEEDYFPGAWGAGSYLGQTYGIPFDVGVWALLYYNKDLFADAGLDPETPPETWEEFLEVGEKLTKDDKYGTAVWIGKGDAIQCMTDAFTFSGGGSIVDETGTKALLNSEAGVNALNFWKACAEISPPGTVERSEEDSFELFTAGQVGMFFYGEWGQDTIAVRAPDMNYGMGLLPKPEGGESIGTFGGFNLAINKDSDNKDLAWEFIVYSTSKDVNKEITMLTPAHKEAAEEYLEKNRDLGKGFADTIYKQLTTSLYRPAVPNYPEIAQVQNTATTKIVLGEATAKEALDKAAEEINNLLNQ
jgi:ABC-type glycerol-3-phosphate transport system substrate-binding protein